MMLQILEDGRLTDSKGRTVDFKNTLIILTSNVGSSVIEKGGGGIGFQLDASEEDSSYNRIKSLVNEELKQYFRPEFLNRLDEIIVFRQLTKSEVKQIADIMLKQVFTRAEEKGIKIDVTGGHCAVHIPRSPCPPLPPPRPFAALPRVCQPYQNLCPPTPPHPTPTHTHHHHHTRARTHAERFKDRLVDEGYNPAYGARPLRRAIMRLLEDSMAERMLAGDIKEGDSVIIDVDADGQISVLNGDKRMTTQIDSMPAGIS